jgi:F-type H+-transporting ATPase subunit gamma
MELKEIKREIESVRNIWKLTGALETLSALKMKKAQKIALLSRPFAQKAAQILGRLEFSVNDIESIFFWERETTEKTLAVVLASDRGFCGSFNHNILKFAEREIKEIGKERKVGILPIGKKATTYFKKRGYDTKFNFFGIGDYAEIEDVKMISDFLVGNFSENKFQEVYLFYTDFISTFQQKPKKLRLLPVDIENLKEFLKEEAVHEKLDFLIEPSVKILTSEIIPQLIEYLIYQAILEGNASEHSARMMAMRNASENAKEKVFELNLQYNKARQEQITEEVCEVSSAKEVLE